MLYFEFCFLPMTTRMTFKSFRIHICFFLASQIIIVNTVLNCYYACQCPEICPGLSPIFKRFSISKHFFVGVNEFQGQDCLVEVVIVSIQSFKVLWKRIVLNSIKNLVLLKKSIDISFRYINIPTCSSNYNIHKSLCGGLCFWASDSLIDR